MAKNAPFNTASSAPSATPAFGKLLAAEPKRLAAFNTLFEQNKGKLYTMPAKEVKKLWAEATKILPELKGIVPPAAMAAGGKLTAAQMAGMGGAAAKASPMSMTGMPKMGNWMPLAYPSLT